MKTNIKNRKQCHKGTNFYSITCGKMQPTDLDALFEIRNIVFIFIEAKYKDNDMPDGQKMSLTNVTDAVTRSGKKALLVHARHEIPENDPTPIDLGSCIVVKTRFNFKWTESKSGKMTVKRIIGEFLKKHGTEIEPNLLKELVDFYLETPKQEELPEEPPLPEEPNNNSVTIGTKKKYEEVKTEVDKLGEEIEKEDGWLSQELKMRNLVNKHQKLAGDMLTYEIDNDMLPI